MTALVLAEDRAAVPPMWARRLQKIEARIGSSEGDGLRARWEFGRELLAQREGKQLPRGLLDAVAEKVGASRQELGRRMAFAERYPTEEELSHAVSKFPSWHVMAREGLRTERPPRPPKALVSPARLALRHAASLLGEVHAADLEEADLRALDALRAELTRLYDEIGQKERS